MATTNWVLFSRARYTLPNFPFPRGRPMSKSCSVHLFVLAERERERERGSQKDLGEDSLGGLGLVMPAFSPYSPSSCCRFVGLAVSPSLSGARRHNRSRATGSRSLLLPRCRLGGDLSFGGSVLLIRQAHVFHLATAGLGSREPREVGQLTWWVSTFTLAGFLDISYLPRPYLSPDF